ncbi:MAG TPA: hypothetical protein VKZ67_10385 [Natronosporangium sp.]|nr:hypothetical protein [Natronosporangium sp.]
MFGSRHRRSVRPRALSLGLLAGLAALMLGGCVVDRESDPGQTNQIGEEVREFDLTQPPSRQEVGLPEGKSQVTYQLPDRQPFPVRVRLPGEHVIDLAVRQVGVDAMAAADPATGPPTTMDIYYYLPDVAAARDHLLALAEEYEFDREPVERWYQDAQAGPPVAGPPAVRTPWLSSSVGYLRLQVRGRYAPPVDEVDPGQVVVHYALSWDPAD